MITYVGLQEQSEYLSLSLVYFHSTRNGHLLGRMNEELTQIDGTGAFFNSNGQIVISTFKKDIPNGHTLTLLENKEAKYSFYHEDG